MTAASGPSTPLPFSLSFATPAISFFVASVTTLSLSGKESGGKTIYYVRTYPLSVASRMVPSRMRKAPGEAIGRIGWAGMGKKKKAWKKDGWIICWGEDKKNFEVRLSIYVRRAVTSS